MHSILRRRSIFIILSATLLAAESTIKADEGGTSVEQANVAIMLVGPKAPSSLDAYMLKECERMFHEHLNALLVAPEAELPFRPGRDMVVIGTAQNNPTIKALIKNGFLDAESKPEGYSFRCAPHPQNAEVWLLAIAGADSRGALWALRDLEHYELDRFKSMGAKHPCVPFDRRDYPRIQHRGHWVWGCNMPDKKGWMENMSRWKMNELIHWDNYLPEKAKEYVDFAHSRGIRVIWGFGWGWNPDWNFTLPENFNPGVGKGVQMCSSDPANRAFFKQEILRKVREDYVPTGCDGIYFQSFTEVPKCQCERCASKTKGQLMLEFVEPIVEAIHQEFPDLWISCGIHRNLGAYDELKELNPRVNIYWENCPSGVSIRGEYEDYGYINKTLPYGHGFSKTCPADPEYTEASLKKWMDSNAKRYAIEGDAAKYIAYYQRMQSWAKGMLGKPSLKKHASTVADHSVFCRRTPFMHVALAEACWNPERDASEVTHKLIAFLSENGGLPGYVGDADSAAASIAAAKVQHDAIGARIELDTPYAQKYSGGGNMALVNGIKAVTPSHLDPAWQGYHRQNLDAVVELGKPMSINGISAGFLHEPRVGVYLPDSVEFAVTRDGKAYEVIKVVKRPDGAEGNRRAVYTVEGLDLYKVTGVRVRAKFLKDWLFVDELMINPTGI